MDGEQFRAAGYAAIDDIINHVENVPSMRVLPTIEPGYLRPQIPENPPVEPEQWSAIQADIESKIKPGLTQWQSPRFMAFYPATISYPSILGEMYSAAFNAPAFNWLCSPACTELETVVMDWVAKALALPACFLSTSANNGGGIIQGSASESIVTVMIAARERRIRQKALAEGLKDGSKEYEERILDLRPRLVALGSDQAHSSTAKAANIAGTRFRTIPTKLEENLEMTGAALRTVLEQCENDGVDPYYITLNLGSTNTCALDRFKEIKDVLSEKESWKQIWVHVDAAYAGSALVVDEYQHIAQDFASGVDSFNFNMHKWLLVNFDASCLFVRNRLDLTNALDITPTYLRNPYSDLGTVIDYRNWQISLGRRFRSLKIWFVMRSYGLNGLKEWIRSGIRCGDYFEKLTRSRPDLFEIISKPAFCLTVLRIRNPLKSSSGDSGTDTATVEVDEVSNTLSKKIYETINARGDIFLTSTVIAGVYAIRVVTAMAREEKMVEHAFDILVRTSEEMISEMQGGKVHGP